MKNNTKNYTLPRLGLLALVALLLFQCKKPQPANAGGIIIDDVDTMSFSIVTDDVDTMSFMIITPVVKKDGQVEKSTIVIDNVDMARIIIDDVDTASYHLKLKERPKRDDSVQQQAQ
jgi:hypothetical protein